MVTVWNPAKQAQDFVFTFFEGGHHLKPLHIQPKETVPLMFLKLSRTRCLMRKEIWSLNRSSGNGKDGRQSRRKSVHFGRDPIRNLNRKATCSQSCQWCDGYNSFYVVDAPFSVGVNGTHQESPWLNITQGRYTIANRFQLEQQQYHRRNGGYRPSHRKGLWIGNHHRCPIERTS